MRPDAQLNPPSIFERYGEVLDSLGALQEHEAEVILEAARSMFDDDAARRASIDARAGLLMGATGIAVALITGVGVARFADASQGMAVSDWLLFVIYVAALVYLGRTAFNVLGVHGPLTRYVLGPEELPIGESTSADTQRELATELLAVTIENFKVNNRAMDRLVVAQRSFRNGILALILGGLAVPTVAYIGERVSARDAACERAPVAVMEQVGARTTSALDEGWLLPPTERELPYLLVAHLEGGGEEAQGIWALFDPLEALSGPIASVNDVASDSSSWPEATASGFSGISDQARTTALECVES